MAADIAQVLRILKYREIDIWLANGRLVAKYRHGHLPADMHSFIAHYRDQLVDQLTAEKDSTGAIIRRIGGEGGSAAENHDPETVARMEKRLSVGFELIEKRRAAGEDVTSLEDFWIDLLHEYEGLCDGRADGREEKGVAA